MCCTGNVAPSFSSFNLNFFYIDIFTFSLKLDDFHMPELCVQIEKVQDGILKWRIPSFPVMELEFKKAVGIINGEKQRILLRKETPIIKGHVNVWCTSHCIISIHDQQYFVVLKHRDFQEVTIKRNDGDQRDSVPVKHLKHTLPFKVLGVTYCKNAKDHFKAAYNHLYLKKGYVHVKVFPEPENIHDRKAVAVFIYDCFAGQSPTYCTMKKEWRNINIEKPHADDVYTANMGGVDQDDQLHLFYFAGYSSRKWYRYIFGFLFNLSVCNGFIHESIFHTSHVKRKCPMISFRLDLKKKLINGFSQRKRRQRP